MSNSWGGLLSRRAANRGGAELTAILAGSPPGVLAVTGGFPNPATFPAEIIGEIVRRLLREEPGIALQYSPSEGLPSVRDYLTTRQEQLQGVRPDLSELMVTSGGMECIDLVCHSLLNPGDPVAVEGPTYLGAIMAFAGYEAEVSAFEMDDEGLRVESFAERLDDGYRPKLIYVIPEHQNPSGRTMSLERRLRLVDLCREHGIVIFEDIAYREISFSGEPLPSIWSLAPDQVIQAGTFSKVFCPGVRLGWAAGPPELIEQLGAAKQNTDQCAGALGQRMVEEYGRAGNFERELPAARRLYASRWATVEAALKMHLPPGCSWSEPTGGFFTWLTLPGSIDTTAMRPAATEAGVAYVAGSPFYVNESRRNELRLSFSHLDDEDLVNAVQRLSQVIRDTVGITSQKVAEKAD
jgi:2-aminoadipate transaminase